jgi:hypothetical protein
MSGNQLKKVDSGKIWELLMLIQAIHKATLLQKIQRPLRQMVQLLSKLLPKLQTQPQIIMMSKKRDHSILQIP